MKENEGKIQERHSSLSISCQLRVETKFCSLAREREHVILSGVIHATLNWQQRNSNLVYVRWSVRSMVLKGEKEGSLLDKIFRFVSIVGVWCGEYEGWGPCLANVASTFLNYCLN